MGIEVMYYGYVSWRLSDVQKNQLILDHNRGIISSLPDSSTRADFHRQIFQVPPACNENGSPLPWYREAAIPFAFSYKNAYVLEAEWIAEFEKLLGNLYWSDAVLHNSFSGDSLHWRNESMNLGREHAASWRVHAERAKYHQEIYECIGDQYDFIAKVEDSR